MSGIIDLSRIPFPNAIEDLDENALLEQFKSIFIDQWAAIRAANPEFPQYDVEMLDSDTAMILAQAFSGTRHLDRQRVNDGIKGLLAPLAEKEDLDNIVARQGIERLVIVPATDENPDPVMETDARLLERYFLSFGAASAGSADSYKFHALTAWPEAGDVKVVGRAIHGRRGDVDIVVTGAGGETPSDEDLALVRAAVTATNVQPETTSVSVLAAKRATYEVDLLIEVPNGPEPSLIKQEAIARITAQADGRTYIDGEIPEGLLAGAAYGNSVLSVTDNSPIVIEPDPYSVPVMSGIVLTAQVRP